MPTYEYRCKECGHELEVVQSFSDEALTECPVCEGVLKKVFHPVGISFKGSGFYKTDARAGSSKSDGAEKTEKTSSSESTTDKKSDTKDSSSKSSESGSSSSSSSSSKAEAKSA